MDRRLIRAYDRMTMPDDCSRGIEEALRKEMWGKKTRHTVILKPEAPWKLWARAAVAVCLTLVLAVGGSGWLLEKMGRTEVVAEESLPQRPVEEAGLFLNGENTAFLEEMCRYMPDWDGYASQDGAFWQELLLRSFSSPEIGAYGRAETIGGEAGISGGYVKISRSQVEEYVERAMGCALPDLPVEGMSGLRYEDGCYYVPLQEQTQETYALRNWEAYEGQAMAVFDVCAGGAEEVTGRITFWLLPEENENGFIINSKQTERGTALELGPDLIQCRAIRETARIFANAYLNGSAWKMEPLLLSKAAQVPEDYGSRGYTVHCRMQTITETLENGAVLVECDFTDKLAGEGCLVLEMLETEEGWKVADYYETPVQPPEVVAEEFARAWLAGDRTGMLPYLSQKMGKTLEEYPEDGTQAVIHETGIYEELQTFDGGPVACVRFSESAERSLIHYLLLELTQEQGSWKVRYYKLVQGGTDGTVNTSLDLRK